MNNGCEFYADALIERADGLLENQRAARLDAHLDACPECQDTLRAVLALRAAPIAVPAGLEGRIQAAVRQTVAPPGDPVEPTVTVVAGQRRRSAPSHWRPWALPLAAAAALVGIWFGVVMPGTGPADAADPALTALAAMDDSDPFGTWPAEGAIVAGDPLLSELSVEELETLLREMGS